MSLGTLHGKRFPIGKEFETFTDDLGCSNAGSGYLFECAWFDAALSGVFFGVVLVITQCFSERMKMWRRLDINERYEWVSSLSNWLLSIVSTSGALYALFVNHWYLDHPNDPANNVYEYTKALNFFIPWMIGYNIGRIIHVISGLVRALHDITMWDTLPHILHCVLYGIILDQKKFGMIAVFQMLLQSHHFYTVPQLVMEYRKMNRDTVCYKVVDWVGFFIKFGVLACAGPYCLAILWFHWHEMAVFSWLTQTAYCIVIGLNTLLFFGDLAFGVYWVYSVVQGRDPDKWYRDLRKSHRREKRRIRKMGYRHVNRREDQVADDSESESSSGDELGQTLNNTHAETELTQRLSKPNQSL